MFFTVAMVYFRLTREFFAPYVNFRHILSSKDMPDELKTRWEFAYVAKNTLVIVNNTIATVKNRWPSSEKDGAPGGAPSKRGVPERGINGEAQNEAPPRPAS